MKHAKFKDYNEEVNNYKQYLLAIDDPMMDIDDEPKAEQAKTVEPQPEEGDAELIRSTNEAQRKDICSLRAVEAELQRATSHAEEDANAATTSRTVNVPTTPGGRSRVSRSVGGLGRQPQVGRSQRLRLENDDDEDEAFVDIEVLEDAAAEPTAAQSSNIPVITLDSDDEDEEDDIELLDGPSTSSAVPKKGKSQFAGRFSTSKERKSAAF